jgi:pyridoxal 5'-phosphate synthase pdxT subunit
MATIGVLAVQGAFAAHARVLSHQSHRVIEVRAASDLDRLDGLVFPGGESSVQLEMIDRLGLEAPLLAFVQSGLPVLATCAGLILLAKAVENPAQRSLGCLDVVVRRNAWGRQVDSFEASSDRGRALVFIRAPRIVDVGTADVLDRYASEPVLVRERNITAATFHPELSDGALHAEVFRRARVSKAGAAARALPAAARA